METSQDFTRAIRARYNARSDYALAKLLQVTPSAISLHKSKTTKAYSEETGYRIAELLDLDPTYVLACLAAERAKQPNVRKVWERLARSLSSAAALLLALALLTPAPPAQAATANGTRDLWVLCQTTYRLLRRWLRQLRRPPVTTRARAVTPAPAYA